jgi:hypothetical protein
MSSAAPVYPGKLADPAFRHERARKAANARNSVDAHIRALVDAAPKLTAEQAAQLRSLLPAAMRRAGDDARAGSPR